MKIISGVEQSALKVVVYGPEGVGKTTIASQFPRPLLLDTEDGARQIDCDKVKCVDWMTLQGAMVELASPSHGYQTVVIDSVDWAEQLLKKHLEVKLGKPVDDLPYGRGYGVIAEAFSKILDAADVLVDRGINVVLVGHSTIKRCTPPDADEGYDRYELKLSKQVGPLVKEWADAILFANYKTRVVEGQDGKARGRGGKDRFLYAERCAAWDAKNRFGLPAEMPMAIDSVAHLWASRQGWMDRVAGAATDAELSAIAADADEARSDGRLSESQHAKLRRLIDSKLGQIHPEEVSA
jgi:hypothetical protein